MPVAQPVARSQPAHSRLQVSDLARTFRAINRKAIRGIPQQVHRLIRSVHALQPQKARWASPISDSDVRRDPAYAPNPVHVDAQRDRVGRVQHFELPSGLRVGVPERTRRVERHSIHRHAEQPHIERLKLAREGRLHRHLQFDFLWANRDRVVPVGENLQWRDRAFRSRPPPDWRPRSRF